MTKAKAKKQTSQDTLDSIKSIEDFKKASAPLSIVNRIKKLLNQFNLL